MTRVVKLREVNGQFLISIPKDIREILELVRGERILLTLNQDLTVTVTKERAHGSIQVTPQQ